MGKLHHVDIARFSMNDSGEIVSRFGMSIECRVEYGWGQEGDPVGFYFRGQKLEGPETHIGDIIYMDHDGPRTTWVLSKKPRDPRLLLLWEFGYRSATRIRVEETTVANICDEMRKKAFGYAYTDGPSKFNSSWNEYGAFIGDGFTSPTIIKDSTGDKVLVALYRGRVFNGDASFCQWFMDGNATLSDIKSALRADCTCNEEHPLLQ